MLAIAAFVAIALGSAEPFYLRIFFDDAARMGATFAELPWRKLPGFQRFLEGVDARTPPGAQIAIAIPLPGWEGGYGYGYYRAAFLLPGKQIVPLLDAPENIQKADYIAAWHESPSVVGFDAIWRSGDGVLLKRTRR